MYFYSFVLKEKKHKAKHTEIAYVHTGNQINVISRMGHRNDRTWCNFTDIGFTRNLPLYFIVISRSIQTKWNKAGNFQCNAMPTKETLAKSETELMKRCKYFISSSVFWLWFYSYCRLNWDWRWYIIWSSLISCRALLFSSTRLQKQKMQNKNEIRPTF